MDTRALSKWLFHARFLHLFFFIYLFFFTPVSVSASISNLYPGCENVSVRSRSMMFEPSLTKGAPEASSPAHAGLSSSSEDEQATRAVDVQHANIHGEMRQLVFQDFKSS